MRPTLLRSKPVQLLADAFTGEKGLHSRDPWDVKMFSFVCHQSLSCFTAWYELMGFLFIDLTVETALHCKVTVLSTVLSNCPWLSCYCKHQGYLWTLPLLARITSLLLFDSYLWCLCDRIWSFYPSSQLSLVKQPSWDTTNFLLRCFFDQTYFSEKSPYVFYLGSS